MSSPVDSTSSAELARSADVTLKCLPRDKSAQGEIITELICLPLLKYRLPHKKSPHYGIAPPPEKSPSADNLLAEIRPARAAAGRGGFLPVNSRPGGTFLGAGGDPIMGHWLKMIDACERARAQGEITAWMKGGWME